MCRNPRQPQYPKDTVSKCSDYFLLYTIANTVSGDPSQSRKTQHQELAQGLLHQWIASSHLPVKFSVVNHCVHAQWLDLVHTSAPVCAASNLNNIYWVVVTLSQHQMHWFQFLALLQICAKASLHPVPLAQSLGLSNDSEVNFGCDSQCDFEFGGSFVLWCVGRDGWCLFSVFCRSI